MMMAVANGKKPHVLAVPLPLQGHVKPLMKLCRQISNLGIKVTFVNTEYIHHKILAATPTILTSDENNNLVLTSIPDGLPPEDDRSDNVKVLSSLTNTMADYLTDLIEKINHSNKDEQISCVIADFSVGWILEVAEKVGAEAVGFVPFSAATLAMVLEAPKLIQQGFLDVDGSIKGRDAIILSDDIPPSRKNDFVWSFPNDLIIQKYSFRWWVSSGKIANDAKWLLCNTSYELESSACNLTPNLFPIGPLVDTTTTTRMTTNNSSSSSFFREDTSCISWLNDKQPASVVYVSFGSIEVPFSQSQIAELALGLENSGRPFLWVLRSDLANGYPDGFLERSSMVGKIVEWAPQEKVLQHPSVACFLSHCGWNSTLEGLVNGVPFLCWPYLVDQFHNRNYICDKWGNGLRIECGENDGLRTRHEIETKIGMLFSDYHSLKANALALKATIAESTVHQGGSSARNLQKFIQHLKVGPGPPLIPSKF